MHSLRAGFMGLCCLLAAALPAGAASLQIAPTTIALPAKGGNATLFVINSGDQPIGVQIEGFAWSQASGTDALAPSPQIQVSPPMTRLKPGERQVIRVRVKPGGDGEQAYRLVANELPDAKDEQRKGIQFRFSFSVPVFTSSAPETAAASGLSWSLNGSTLTMHNGGASRAKLSALRLVASSGSEIPVASGNLVYVLAGASMQWQVGAPPGGALRIRGRDDRSGRDIEAAVGRS